MNHSHSCNSYSDTQLISLLQEDSDYLECVFKKTKDLCIKFMQKQCNGIELDELNDIYHDALIVLYDKSKKGQFELTSSIQTYLNSICWNQLLNKFKESNKIKALPDSESNTEDCNDEESFNKNIRDWLPNDYISYQNLNDLNNERVLAMISCLEKMRSLKGHCYELLKHIYWKKVNYDSIANIFNFKNNQNARNAASDCREKLRKMTFRELNIKR